MISITYEQVFNLIVIVLLWSIILITGTLDFIDSVKLCSSLEPLPNIYYVYPISMFFSINKHILKQNKCLLKQFERENQEEKVLMFITSTTSIDDIDECRGIKGFDYLKRFKPIISCLLSINNRLTAMISEFPIHIFI